MTTIGQSYANSSKTGTYTSSAGKVYTSNKAPKVSSSGSSGGGSSTPTAAPVVTPAKDMNQARIDALGGKGDATPTFATQAETDQYNKTMALMKSTNGQGNPISTTTLTNGNVIDNVIPENNSKLDTLGVKGAVTNPDGSQSNADGSIISDGETKGYTYQGVDGNIYDSKTGKIVEGSVDVGAIENKADQNTNDLLESMKAMTDANTAAQIENIKASYAVRKQQQADSNTRNESSVMNALLMGGVTGQGSSSQYAPVSSTGIVSAQETYGIQQIANLDAEENNLIAQAKQAQEEGNYRLMEKQLDLVEAKRKEKTAMAIKINDSIIATNKAQQDKAFKSETENNIASLYAQGMTATEIMNAMNEKGWGIDSKTVSDTIANLAKAAGTDLEGLSGDIKEYYAIVSKGLPLPASVAALDKAAQPYAYAQYKANLTRKASGAGVDSYSFSNTDRGALIGTGLSNSMVDHLEQGINEYGINEVLAKETGLTEDQKAVLISKVSGKKPEVINDAYIADKYDDATLRKAANQAGYNVGGGAMTHDYGVPDDQLAEYKKDLMATVEMYRKMGLSEKDIQTKLDTKITELADSYAWYK